MTEDAQIRSVALFYFYGLLDEAIAYEATIKTLARCRKRIKNSQLELSQVPSVIVHATNTYWEKAKKSKLKGRPNVSYEGGWLVPKGEDLGAWKQFQTEAEVDEFLAVVWSRILKFTDEQISEGLGVTVGTVRHRVGRGLRMLGAMRKAN